MPSLLLPRFSLQDMSDKKSPPRKEKPFVVRTPQPDDKGMKRKLLSPASPTHDDDDKKTPNKRKRGSLSLEASPMTNPKTPGGGSRSVPLSERQQLAMIMRMSDESTQENTLRPSSPTALLPGIKKSQLDKKVFKRNERGEMPIHLAAIKGDIKLLKKLIKAGADVNVADFAGWTPLHEASNRGWLYIAKQLLKAGANVNVQGLENDTPLHDASINGHTKLVELLLKHGANPLQQNAKGKTPLDVAPSTDMVKILKKETICSGSDTSSIEDVRSPMSPDSVLSLKDDDKSLDSEDMHQNNRSESFSSSSSNRRLSMPKSPDGKLSSPRLCLKFHRDNFGYTNQKSLDSNEPQYKSYSVTNMSVDSNIDTPMFSPSDSPASSVDSDLYNPGLDNFTNFSGSKLKISLPDDENSKFDSRSNLMIPALRFDGNALNEAKEVFPDKATDISDENSDHNSIVGTTSDINSSKSVLKPMETLPFNANVQWSESRNEDSLDLPDLEIDTSDPIPVNSYKNNGISDFVQECNLVSSSSVKSPGQSGVNHSSVTSSTELQQQPELLNSETEKSVTNSVVTSNSTNDCPKQSDEADNQSDNIVKLTELSSNTVTSAESADSCLCSMSSSKTEDSDKINNIVPCSPNRTERDSKDSRPSTPKVPPLKIIIPPKSQAISTPTHTNERLKVGTKSALPYVINPYQDQDREADAQPEESGLEQTQPSLNTYLQPVQNPSYLDVPSNSDSEFVMNLKKLESNKNSDENVDMEIDYSEVNSVKPSQDNELDDKEDTKSDSDSKKDENKKDEPTQRVLRSTVRSQQLSTESKPPKQQKQPEKPERSNDNTMIQRKEIHCEPHMLPTKDDLNKWLEQFDRRHKKITTACTNICAYIKEQNPKIISVWPAYNSTSAKAIVFVLILESNQDLEADFNIKYDYVKRLWGHPESREERLISEYEKSNSVGLTKEECEKLDKCIDKHGRRLMKTHKFLSIISKSAVRSSQNGKRFCREPCMTLYVYSKGHIPIGEDPFDKEYDGVPVDVREGTFTPYVNPASEYQNNLKIGCQIAGSSPALGAGTLGGFIDHPRYGLCGTTCAHVLFSKAELKVLAEDKESPGQQEIHQFGSLKNVYQPATTNYRIGKVVKVVHKEGGDGDFGIDAALFTIETRYPLSGEFPRAEDQEISTREDCFDSGQPFQHSWINSYSNKAIKYGFQTNKTDAYFFRSEENKVAVKIVDGCLSEYDITLHNQIAVNSAEFASKGDSGALVFIKRVDSELACVGSIVGGTSTGLVIITPIEPILREFDVLSFKNFSIDRNTHAWKDLREEVKSGFSSVHKELQTITESIKKMHQGAQQLTVVNNK